MATGDFLTQRLSSTQGRKVEPFNHDRMVIELLEIIAAGGVSVTGSAGVELSLRFDSSVDNVDYTYFVHAPSGDTKLLQTIVGKLGAATVNTFTFTYDNDGDVATYTKT